MTVGKEKERKSRERKGEKSMVALLFFYFGYFREKTTEPILAVIMLSKIQLDI